MLYFVPTPIGNLEDISHRSLALLLSTPVIFCEDTRVTKRLIALLSERFGRDVSCEQRFIAIHSHNEKEVVAALSVQDFADNALYVSDAGMPCISDPGAALVQFAQQNNIPYEVLPGANALLLALASSGFEGTKFYFHGFLPHKKEAREREIREILSMPCNIVLYESTHRIEQFCLEISQMEPDRVMFLIKEASKKYENHIFGNAKEVYEKVKNSNQNGEWAAVIKAPLSAFTRGTIGENDILTLDIPSKAKAKLLSKITDKSVKEWYERLNKSDN